MWEAPLIKRNTRLCHRGSGGQPHSKACVTTVLKAVAVQVGWQSKAISTQEQIVLGLLD